MIQLKALCCVIACAGAMMHGVHGVSVSSHSSGDGRSSVTVNGKAVQPGESVVDGVHVSYHETATPPGTQQHGYVSSNFCSVSSTSTVGPDGKTRVVKVYKGDCAPGDVNGTTDAEAEMRAQAAINEAQERARSTFAEANERANAVRESVNARFRDFQAGRSRFMDPFPAFGAQSARARAYADAHANPAFMQMPTHSYAHAQARHTGRESEQDPADASETS